MLRYSMSRKISAVLHFPKELVRELTSDLQPVQEAGFHPMKIDVTVEVSGRLGPSGALIPIKDLHEILKSALEQSDLLQSSLATLSKQLWEHVAAAIERYPRGEHSPDLVLSSLELAFENGVRFKLRPESSTLALKYPLSFQHAVEFDLGAAGEKLHHGHDAQVEVTLEKDAEDAERFLAHHKRHFDATVAATGEMIVKAIAESVRESGFQQEILSVKLRETEKNGFSAFFDKLPSSAHK